MLKHLTFGKRLVVYASLFIWAAGSLWAGFGNHADLFAAFGSFALCISFGVFLTDRFATQEARRRWDSQILTQTRMMWRYQQHQPDDPTPRATLHDQITQSFDDLLAAKAAESKLETYRYELVFSVVATLQWGFGHLLLTLLHKGAAHVTAHLS